MNASVKVGIVVVLAAAIVGVIALKERGAAPESAPAGPTSAPAAAGRSTPLPRLLELGSTLCVPCKMMEPIIDELRRDYAGQLRVDFINVHEDEAAAEKYGIRVIPTQIFFDASGTERFRHEGFFSKADILAKWKELGVELTPGRSEASKRMGHE